jgi:predicted nuclease of predicted toxin-antitoxin system
LKLLFDENLSRKLPKKLADLCPGSKPVTEIGLERATDIAIRKYAAENKFIIVSRDSDFEALDAVHGAPPKVIWIHRQNASTADYEVLLRKFREQVEAFALNDDRSLLIIN